MTRAKPRTDKFDTLLEAALAKWPPSLRLPVVPAANGGTIVEGLIKLENEISRQWQGHPQEVLMVNLNWAICGAYHTAFDKQEAVSPDQIDADQVRKKFEADLRRIRAGKVPTWTESDRSIAADYFKKGRGAS
jgi:hypothetical protein